MLKTKTDIGIKYLRSKAWYSITIIHKIENKNDQMVHLLA